MLQELCNNASNTVLIEHNGVSPDWGCNPFSSSIASVTVWLNRMSACTCTGLSPMPMVIWCPWNSNRIQCESTLLNARYYYTPHPVLVLLLVNLLRYRGPTIVKPVLCLEPGQWAWTLNGSRQELYCVVEVPPHLPNPYKSPEPPVMSEEPGWTAGSTHLHHALGASQGVTCSLQLVSLHLCAV